MSKLKACPFCGGSPYYLENEFVCLVRCGQCGVKFQDDDHIRRKWNRRTKRETRLKPCPFCAGKATLSEHGDELHYVICPKCNVRSDGYSNPDEAIDAWNRRIRND